MRALIALALLLVAGLGPASAHDPSEHGGWSTDPLVLGPILLAVALYGLGVARLWCRAGIGRGIRAWQPAACAVGLGTLALALLSPLHELGDRLLSLHMVEHELVMLLAPPLLVLARPLGAFAWSLPPRSRSGLGRVWRLRGVAVAWTFLTSLRNATILHGLAIWIWHVPRFFDAAASNLMLHRLQHVSFLATALAFWWAALRARGTGEPVWHMFATLMHTSLLGAIMTLSPRLLYLSGAHEAPGFGLTPLEDQQLAGLVMWIPAGAIYAGAAIALLGSWIVQASHGTRYRDALHKS